MKTRNVIYVFVFLLFCVSLQSKQIISNPAGGNWASPDSWVGGVVPSDSDEVMLISNIEITDALTVKNILVNEGSTLTIKTSANKIVFITDTLEVNGGLSVLKNSLLRVLVLKHSKNAELVNESIIEVGECNK